MAVTSPRVIEIATGERVSFEDLGGPAVHARITGQVDAVAEDDDDVIRIIIDFLSYLPSNAWSAPPRTEAPPDAGPDPELLQIVPSKRTRGYDIRSVIRRLVDGRKLLELKPEFGRSLTTCLARMNGETVGILATNPMFLAGALDQNACRKATLFICLCDAFNIPLLFLQDTPGFIVGKLQEHDGLLPSVINFQQAMFLAEVPRVTVMLRKSFGVAWLNMGGLNRGNALTFAWPSAEISFMDPEVGVNVLYADRLKDAPDAEEQRAQLMAELSRDTDPYGAAGAMQLDDIIDPYETRSVITRAFDRLRTPPRPRGHPRPLASWPSAY
jgi:acetyl-CoA carboxylase carboxyltransferase component